MKVSQIYRIEKGVLAGTELEPTLGMILVKYPHRHSKDAYIPPMKCGDKEIKTFHCLQSNCKQPNFEGGMDDLAKHLELHAGRLFKKLKPITKSTPARIVVTLPPNPWAENDNRGANPDRRLCVQLYIDSLQRALARQGVGVKAAQDDRKPQGGV